MPITALPPSPLLFPFSPSFNLSSSPSPTQLKSLGAPLSPLLHSRYASLPPSPSSSADSHSSRATSSASSSSRATSGESGSGEATSIFSSPVHEWPTSSTSSSWRSLGDADDLHNVKGAEECWIETVDDHFALDDPSSLRFINDTTPTTRRSNSLGLHLDLTSILPPNFSTSVDSDAYPSPSPSSVASVASHRSSYFPYAAPPAVSTSPLPPSPQLIPLAPASPAAVVESKPAPTPVDHPLRRGHLRMTPLSSRPSLTLAPSPTLLPKLKLRKGSIVDLPSPSCPSSPTSDAVKMPPTPPLTPVEVVKGLGLEVDPEFGRKERQPHPTSFSEMRSRTMNKTEIAAMLKRQRTT